MPILLQLKTFKINFVIMKDRRIVLIKFDVDPCTHGENLLDQKSVDGQMVFSFI